MLMTTAPSHDGLLRLKRVGVPRLVALPKCSAWFWASMHMGPVLTLQQKTNQFRPFVVCIIRALKASEATVAAALELAHLGAGASGQRLCGMDGRKPIIWAGAPLDRCALDDLT